VGVGRQLSLAERNQLCEAFLNLAGIGDRSTRDLYFSELERHQGWTLPVPRYADAKRDVFSLISTCLEYPGAIQTLVFVVEFFHRGSTSFTELKQLVERLLPGLPLRVEERVGLRRLLARVDRAQVAAAWHTVNGTGDHKVDWDDVDDAVRRLEAYGKRAEEPAPPLLLFVERVAHDTGGRLAVDLHRWIDGVGVRTGLDQDALRHLCVEWGVLMTPRAETTDDLPPMVNGPADAWSSEPSTTIWGGVPARNPDFTGRGHLLTALRQVLVSRERTAVVPQVLYGISGVGKTQLAVEYVYRYAGEYDLIWWIPAERSTQVKASLAGLAAQLGLPTDLEVAQTASAVLEALRTRQRPWLLVYDNADEPEQLEGLIPAAGGHVLVTLRNLAWGHPDHAIEVDVFDRAESLAFLRRRVVGISDADADELAAKLGDLPLALEQAATWLAETAMTVPEYLHEFDQHVAELLSEGKPLAYPRPVAATFAFSFERLRQESPSAFQLLELFAFFGAKPVSIPLLRRARKAELVEPLGRTLGDAIEMNRAVRLLRRYALARVAANGQTMQVHPLVRAVLRESMTAEQLADTQRDVHRILAAAGLPFADSDEQRALHAEIAPHLVPSGILGSDEVDCRWLVLDQIDYLYTVGDYKSSRELSEAAIGAWRARFGPDDEATRVAEAHLARSREALGHPSELDAGRPSVRSPYDHRSIREPLHHTIVAMDVVDSGRLVDLLQLRMRADLRAIVTDVLARQSLDPVVDYTDLGDGIRLIVPPTVTPAAMLDPFVPNLASALRQHRLLVSEAARLRLRIAVHMGLLHRDPGGWAGAPLVTCARMLDARPVRRVMAAADRPDMVLVVSQAVYDGIVRHGYGLDPAGFQPVDISEKEMAATVWVHVPGYRVPLGLDGQRL
jgi:hypothetical protein